jgi:hypothetical protein
MHCSRCGVAISENLNFCSKCGERVRKDELAEPSKKQNSVLDTVATTTIFVGVGGMLFLVGLIAVLSDKPIPIEAIVVIAGMYLAAWLAIMFLLVRQMTRFVDANLKERGKNAEESAPPLGFPRRATAQLEEHREPASVIEPTTRTLDEIKIERNR